MSKPLAGKKALVTGGGRGIGRGIAEALAAAGADVVINYLSASNEANETCDNCKKFGVKAFAFKADASELNTIEKLVDDAENAIGPLDLVVSNAVYSDRQIFYEADLEGFQRTIQVSMWGPFYLVRTVANRMIARKQQGGSIVVISSPHAHKPIPGAMAYNMAKAAIDQMARTAAVELSPHRIRVNIVHPGWTDTRVSASSSPKQRFAKKQPSYLGDALVVPMKSGAASCSYVTLPATTSPVAR